MCVSPLQEISIFKGQIKKDKRKVKTRKSTVHLPDDDVAGFTVRQSTVILIIVLTCFFSGDFFVFCFFSTLVKYVRFLCLCFFFLFVFLRSRTTS